MEQSILSALELQNLVFDELHFKRLGFRNDEESSIKITVQIGTNEEQDLDIVSVVFEVNKLEEYELRLRVSGYFKTQSVNASMKQTLLEKNAVAILMPYIRSEITLLTSQPETDPLILPVFNVNEMINQSKRDQKS